MGLDIVECIMRIEEEFGVELDDTELSNSRTVGECYEMVVRRMTLADRGTCLSQKAFHRLRRALIAQFDLPRCAIALEMPLDGLIPMDGRREAWDELERRLRLVLPPCQLPDRLYSTAAAVVMAAGVAGWAAGSWLVGGISLIPGAMLWSRLMQPFVTELPVRDVRALTREVLHQNFDTFAQPHELTSTQVWERMVGIIVQQLDIAPERVTYEAQWVQDLEAC